MMDHVKESAISYVKARNAWYTRNSIEEYNATHKPFCDKCEPYEWNHTISFKNGDKYLLCNGCVKFFKNIKNKEMAGIKDIEKIR